nr:RsiV family protein [Lachnospiraceae bacterium]
QGKGKIIFTDHELECDIDGITYSVGSYTDILLPNELKEKYPKLSKSIDELNGIWKDNATTLVGLYGPYGKDEDPKGGSTFWYKTDAKLIRADDALFTVLGTMDDYSGGAHPYGGKWVRNYDPNTGYELILNSVLDDDTDFAKHLYDEMMKTYPKEKFGGMDMDEVRTLIEESYFDGLGFLYYIDDKGLNIHFDPEYLAPYASGDFDVLLTYEDYPDLIKEKYRTDGKGNYEPEYKKADKVKVEPDYGELGDNEEPATYTMQNPTWKYYTSDRAVPTGTLIRLDSVSEKKSDWLDTDKWINDGGYEGTSLPYYDGAYYYEAYNPKEYDYMYQNLKVYYGPDASGTVACDFDLSVLCNGPDEKEQKYSKTTQYIRYAKMVNDILYVSIGHNGYSANEKESNYIVAIEPNEWSVLWRSEPLVCNSRNFVILDDALVCGYGFTDEPDYIYVLDLGDGSTVNKKQVRSAPEVFVSVDDELRVATYNTEYIYSVSFG